MPCYVPGLACSVLWPGQLGEQLVQDSTTFQDKGLEGFSDKEKASLVERYTPYQDHPMVGEIFDWLKGEYEFDPDCLT